MLGPIGDPSNLVAELELPSSGRLTTLNFFLEDIIQMTEASNRKEFLRLVSVIFLNG